MNSKIAEKSLLSLLMVIILAIVVLGYFIGIDNKDDVNDSSNMVSLEEIGSNSTSQSSSPESLILTDFEGEYEKDGQTIVVSSSGEKYVVEDGYVLSGEVRVDARDESRISVYELENRQK